MVQVVTGGDSRMFDALVYGDKHPSTVQYFQDQLSTISNTLTDAGRSFYSKATDLWDRFHGSEAMRLARAALRKAGSVFQKDNIRPLYELGEFQNAPLTLQRWIMAEPTIREMYHQQRCDGYSDTYVDMEPGVLGRDHYDFQQVMHGMVVDTEDDWRVTFYLNDLKEGDRELTHDEKTDVLSLWDFVKCFVNEGKDPTDVRDSSL